MLIIAALAVLVFTPRTHAGAAWAQTLAASFDAVPSYSYSLDAQGRIGYEEWRSGRKRAHVLYSRGKPMMEWRDDGRRLYNYAGEMFSGDAPNARLWGMVSKSAGPSLSMRDEIRYGSPEALLKQPGVEVVDHQEAVAGRPETYRLRVPRPYGLGKETMVAEIDPADRRIHRLTRDGEQRGTTIEYPVISASVFEPRPQKIPGVDVYDLAAQSIAIQKTLRQGLGKKGPVTLRLVTIDGSGTLWAFWTGALPDAKLSHRVRVPGVPSTEYATKKAFTSDWKPTPYARLSPNVTGERIGGMSFVPQRRLGSTVDLDVPYPGGVARFRHVPVLRVGLLNHYEELLGIYTVYPPVVKKGSRKR